MRVVLASSLVLLLACGGAAQKPAESSSSDDDSKSSLNDSKSASSKSGDKDPEDLAPPMAAEAAPTPAPKPKAAAPAEDDAPPPAYHPAPSVTGMIDGKPFSPKVARILSAPLADGRVALSLTEGSTCDVTPSDPAMTITVTWKQGYKTDLASLKRASKKSVNEVGFARSGAAKGYSTSFKPTGTVQVMSAPVNKGTTGKLKLDVTAGEYILAGDIDVLVCTATQ